MRIYYNEWIYSEDLKTHILERAYMNESWKFTGRIKYLNLSVDDGLTDMKFEIINNQKERSFLSKLFNIGVCDPWWLSDVYLLEELTEPTKSINVVIEECSNETLSTR